jgi:hypothetical protein
MTNVAARSLAGSLQHAEPARAGRHRDGAAEGGDDGADEGCSHVGASEDDVDGRLRETR